MRRFLLLGIVAILLQQSVAPPVTKNQDEEGKNKENEVDEQTLDEGIVFEYQRYLNEVVQALESDPTFREKLEKAEEADIRTGKIAQELEYVNHHVRTKLDEIKRSELERLKALVRQRQELDEGKKVPIQIPQHLDLTNRHTFEIEDLKKLIAKTTEDLAEADRKRRQEFKEYEMQKKFEEEQKMKALTEEEKKKYAEELEKMKEKHKKHEPLHHPGSKQQLEEVWEKQDHMQDQEFNPKTFFFMHDLDGNGYWDQDEVKALFLKELDKMYNEGAPEDDLRERAEEMERMREHVFNEADTNRDGFIDYEEFVAQTKREEFQKDPGWKPLDEQEIYSQQEYEAFERRRQEEIQRMIAQGLIPPHPDYGHTGQFPPHHQDPNQVHPGQVPQQHYQGQHPQQYQGQPPVQQPYQGQVPVQHQVPVQPQQYQGQVPPQQQYQGQVPSQQYQGQVPLQQQQQHQGQVPVQQQVPQGQPIQQQYQPPVQQVPRDQVPPSGQFQPNTAQVNTANAQASVQTQNAQNQPAQQQANPQQTSNGPAQPSNAASTQNSQPSVVHT